MDATANGPAPRAVLQIAIADVTSVAVVAPRCWKRIAAKTTSGNAAYWSG